MERWRPVCGHEWSYEVSDYGNVRSVARTVYATNRIIKYSSRVLAQHPDSGGYMHVTLCDHGTRRSVGVHKLVLEAFVSPRPEGMEARHYPDPNRSNNHLTNLSWATRSVNSRDKIEHGSHPWLQSDGSIERKP